MPSSKYQSTKNQTISSKLECIPKRSTPVQEAEINAKETQILLSVSDCVSANGLWGGGWDGYYEWVQQWS
jgi:hypothetical protein